MTGTVLNAAGILLGGFAGLWMPRPLAPKTQVALKGLLGVAVAFVGLRMVVLSLSGGFWSAMKQLLLVILAMMLGGLLGRWLRLQKGVNRLGQFARDKFTRADGARPPPFGEGFLTGTVLFCVGPLGIFGAILDGLNGAWHTLALKAAVDGLATMAFVSTLGWSTMASIVPLIAYQGSMTLCARWISPFLLEHGLLDSVNATSGLLVFTIALIVLEIRRVEWADYLPSLAMAPFLTWWWP